ncbi:MAG: orotidine-5'-phosphate decarboxylase [Deltaproteobacteria bacterium]|nr:orotidine-5'-phosphate decarboxylase [Deltaproteobacteria bacterium]
MAELVVALDLTPDRAQTVARSLRGLVPWVKVGLELFVRSGPDIVAELKVMGFKVFLDLKFLDIPNTVAGAVRSGAASGADMLTLHLLGGADMLRAAVSARNEVAKPGPLLMGVTVLTSVADPDTADSGKVAGLAREGLRMGLDGSVCSAREAQKVKALCGPGHLVLTPGIRRPGDEVGDQARTMSPEQAVREGSDFLVVGRPIIGADDPARAVQDFVESMRGV